MDRLADMAYGVTAGALLAAYTSVNTAAVVGAVGYLLVHVGKIVAAWWEDR